MKQKFAFDKIGEIALYYFPCLADSLIFSSSFQCKARISPFVSVWYSHRIQTNHAKYLHWEMKCTFYRIQSSTQSSLWHRLLREVWERIDDQSTATTTVCANTECEPRFTSLIHRKQKLRQYIYASLKMCSFGQLFSSLNIILITLELKIIGESCVIIRLNIMIVN